MSDEIDVGGFNRNNRIVRPPPVPPFVFPEIDNIDRIRELLAVRTKLYPPTGYKKKILDSVDLDGVVNLWKSRGFKKIITLVGPGISRISNVPDYCSKNSELCRELVDHYHLHSRSALFELDHVLHQPIPFYQVVCDIFPGCYSPNVYHYFIRLLAEKNLLLRHYTQNVDMLERLAGIPADRLIEAHGTFASNHCVHCHKAHSLDWMQEEILAAGTPECSSCGALVLPDLVFVNQHLPPKYYQLAETDMLECDLLIVMGTTLDIHPFAKIFDRVDDACVRLLIVDEDTDVSTIPGWQEGNANLRRDVLWRHDPNEAMWKLAAELGLLPELEALIHRCTKINPSIERSSLSLANRTRT